MLCVLLLLAEAKGNLHMSGHRWKHIFDSHRQPAGPRFVASLMVSWLALCASASAQNTAVRSFRPVPSPYSILGQHSSRGIGHGVLFIGSTTDYANDELVSMSGNLVVDKPVAHRIVSEFGLGVGLWQRLDLSLSLPIVVGRWARGRLIEGQERFAFGPGDLRLMAKAVAMKNQRWHGFGLAAVLELSLPTGRKGQFLAESRAFFAPRLVFDYRYLPGALVTFNVGYLLRRKTWIGDLPVDDEVLLGLGIEQPLGLWNLSVLGAVDTAIGLGKSMDGTRLETRKVPMEARFGIRWRGRCGLQAGLGAGLGLLDGYGSPDVRILASVGFGRDLSWTGCRSQPRPAPHLSPWDGSGPGLDPEKRTRHEPKAVSRIDGNRSGKPNSLSPPPAPSRQEPGQRLSRRDLERALSRDPDPDGDGIPNGLDRCPDQPEDRDGFQDQDGCPDEDNDRDGVPDIHDKCPLAPETVNGVEDDDGCPDKGRAKVALSRKRIRIFQKVLFARGSDRIDPRSFPLLRQVAALLKKAWWVRLVRIEGHTDSQGDQEKNVDLSIRRAYRVRAFLVRQGVAPERLQARGYGAGRPLADNATVSGRAKNRRVVFVIVETRRHPSAASRSRTRPAGKRGEP